MRLGYKQQMRLEALRAQNFRCYYCKADLPWEQSTLDHREPKSKGGFLHPDNVVAACEPCNDAKADLPLSKFMGMIKKSKPPHNVPASILFIWASRRIYFRTMQACERIERAVA